MPSAFATVRPRIDVPLTEEWRNEFDFSRFTLLNGQTTNSVMGNNAGPGYPWGLFTQQHVDIRTFVPNTSQYSENWTNSTGISFQLGPEVYLNNWNALVTNVLGVTSYNSITTKAVDVTQFGTSANIIMALPNFQLVYIDPATSYLELSSDGFNTYTSLLFDNSTTPLVTNADCVVTWPISFVEAQNNGTDLTKITSVRLRFQTYDQATLMMAALRLVGPNWVTTNVDIDNWNGAIRQCIPPNAARGVFPVAANRQLPTLWYSAPTTGEDDPQPINATMGVLFNTGSMIFSNSFGISMRAVGGTDVSQLSINGSPQAVLEGPQPSLSTAAELPREVADLQGLPMSQLSGQSVFNLSARQENIAESWINFSLVWGSGIPSVSVTKSDTGQGYTWTGTAATAIAHLSPNTFYLCLMSVNDTITRMQVLNVNQTTFQIVQPWSAGVVFDTGPIQDGYLFPRRRGRIGFTTNLVDGDAQIRAVRPHALAYATWQTVPMQSNTPVRGARLYASYAPHEQLWSSWSSQAGQYGATPLLNSDTSRTVSGSSTKVTIQNGTAINQGVISNVLTPADDALTGIIDWANTIISFDVWFPQTGLQNPLSAYLLSQDGAQIPLNLPAIAPGTWQTVVCYPPAIPSQYLSVMQSGRYQLVLIYMGTTPLSFWIDNVQVLERTVTWDARANPTDPWTGFADIISSEDGGILFNKGTSLQVRGVAHRQDDVVLAPPRVIPQYAPLGRLVWPENQVADAANSIWPYVTITGSMVHGSTVTFDATNSMAVGNNLINNGDFEQGATNWTTNIGGGTDVITPVSSPVWAGTTSMQITVGSNARPLAYTPPLPSIIDTKQLYTAVGWMYLTTGYTQSISPTRLTPENVENGGIIVSRRSGDLTIKNTWQMVWTIGYPNFINSDTIRYPSVWCPTTNPGQIFYMDSIYYMLGDARRGIANFVWNFGDGTVGSGAYVQHTYLAAGQYSVSCVMTDNFGASTVYTTIVSVT